MRSVIPSFVHFTSIYGAPFLCQVLGQDLGRVESKAHWMAFVLTLFRSLLKCHPIQEAPPTYHPTQQSSLYPCHSLDLTYFPPFPHILFRLFSSPSPAIM